MQCRFLQNGCLFFVWSVSVDLNCSLDVAVGLDRAMLVELVLWPAVTCNKGVVAAVTCTKDTSAR